MRQGRINWNLIIVLVLAVVAVAVTSVGLRKYHRSQRAEVGLTEGLAAYEAGQWKDAAGYLGQYLALNPNDVDCLIKYAQSNLRIQPFKREALGQAVNAYRVVLRLEDHPQAARDLVELYLQSGMPAEAELIARRFVQDDPEGWFRLNLAVSLMHQRKYAEAFETLTGLIEEDTRHVAAFKLLGEIAEKRSDLTSIPAAEWLDQAVISNPDSAQAYMARSTYRTGQGDFQAAFEDIERAESCELDIDSRLTLAAVWLRQRQPDRAATHLAAVEAAEPDNAALWHLRSVLATQMTDPSEIAAVADAGLAALGAENYDFMATAAELYVQAGDLDRAAEILQTLQQAEAERSTILYLEGLLAQAGMDWTEAIEKWRQAIQLGYSSERAYLNLAAAMDQINNRPAAIQLLRRYVSQSAGAFRAHLRLAQLLAKDQHWQDALEQATAAMQLNPASLESRLLNLHCRIELLDARKQVDATLLRQAIEKLVALHDTAASRMLLCYLEMKLDRYDAAQAVITEVVDTFGPSEDVTLAHARLLMNRGQREEAYAMLEQAVQERPEADKLVQLLVWGYTQDGRLNTARALLETLKDRVDGFPRRQYRLWLAEILIEAGQSELAVADYRQMAAENPSDILVRRRLLAVLQETADPAQLQQWIDEIQAAEGKDGWQWKYEQARFWFAREGQFDRRYAEIVKLLSENIGINAEDQASRILLAASHERAGNIQLALSLYQDATPRQSANIEFIAAAVGAMYRAQEYRQAEALLARAAESGIQDPRLARYELQNSLRRGQEEDAMAMLTRMVTESPEDDDAALSLAILQMRSGQFEAAEKHLTQILIRQPESAAATTAMAELYLKQDQPDQALALCDRYLAAHDTLPAHIMRCQVLVEMDDTEGAEKAVQALLARFDGDAEAQLAAARLYPLIGRQGEAVGLLKDLLTVSGDNFAYQKQAAAVFLDHPDPSLQAQGSALMEKALQQNPADVQLRLLQARQWIRQGTAASVQQAKTVLSQLVLEYPRLERAWVTLGQVALVEQNAGQAMDVVLRGLSYWPHSKQLLLLKAQIQGLRSVPAAIESLEALYARHPQDLSTIFPLAQNYRKAGRLDEARHLLEDSLRIDSLSDSAVLTNTLIAVLDEAGRHAEAETLYRSLSEKTDNPAVLLNWVDLLARRAEPAAIADAFEPWSNRYPDRTDEVLVPMMTRMGQMDHPQALAVATDIAQRRLERHPDSPAGYQAMATLLHVSGRKKEAIDWYEKAIERDPTQVVAVNNLAWILCTEIGEADKALAYAQQGLLQDPSYVDLIDTRGTIYMHLGDYEKAAADFRQCKRLYFNNNPNRTVAMLRLGECLLKTGQKTAAQAEFMDARDWDAANRHLSEPQRSELDTLLRQALH